MEDTWSHLHELKNSLRGHRAAATFACGGKVNSKTSANSSLEDLFLLYEDKHSQAHRINFPASAKDFEALTKNCDPATFGVLKEEKLDLDYRSAWKLDKTKFLTSFHPSDSDVMKMISYMLLPASANIDGRHSVILAELYKLNVYSFISRLTIDL